MISFCFVPAPGLGRALMSLIVSMWRCSLWWPNRSPPSRKLCNNEWVLNKNPKLDGKTWTFAIKHVANTQATQITVSILLFFPGRALCVWRGRDTSRSILCRFHHHEPWLCRPHWTARQSQGSQLEYILNVNICHSVGDIGWFTRALPPPTGPVPSCGHDGTRLCNDSRDIPVLIWLQRCQSPLQEDHHHLQALLWTAQLSGGNLD